MPINTSNANRTMYLKKVTSEREDGVQNRNRVANNLLQQKLERLAQQEQTVRKARQKEKVQYVLASRGTRTRDRVQCRQHDMTASQRITRIQNAERCDVVCPRCREQRMATVHRQMYK